MLALFGFTVLLWVFGAPSAPRSASPRATTPRWQVRARAAARPAPGGLAGRGAQHRVGVLLLFGGGLTLSKALAASGAAAWLATQLGPARRAAGLGVHRADGAVRAAAHRGHQQHRECSPADPALPRSRPHVERAPLAVLVAVGTSCAFMLRLPPAQRDRLRQRPAVPQRMMILGGSGVTVLVYPALVLAALIALGVSVRRRGAKQAFRRPALTELQKAASAAAPSAPDA